MPNLRASLRPHLPFLVIAPFLIVVMTYPTIVHVFDWGSVWVPARNYDIWIEFWDGWYGSAFLRGQADLAHTNLSFYPEGVSLAFHQFSYPHMLALGALMAVMPASNAYCLLYLLIIFACAASAYVYISWLFKDRWLGLPGAVIFGFSQHVMGHAQHPGEAAIYTLPLALYFLQRGLNEDRPKLVAIAGLLTGFTAFISLYIFVFLGMTLGLFLLIFYASRFRERRFWLLLILFVSLAGAVGALRFYPMLADSSGLADALSKNAGDETATDLLAYFVNYRHPTLTPLFYDVFGIRGVAVNAWDHSGVNGWNHTSYLGYIPLLLIGIGILRRLSRGRMWRWLLVMAPFLILRLGSVLRVNDQVFDHILLPKHILNQLLPPIFGAVHEADHYMIGVLLPLAVLACYGLDAALRSLNGRRRHIIILAVTLICAWEISYTLYSTPVTKAELKYIDWLAEEPDQDSIRLINLPMSRGKSKLYMFHQTLNGYPQVEGLARRIPRTAYQYINANSLLSDWGNHRGPMCSESRKADYLAALDQLIGDGFTHIVLHTRDPISEILEAGFAFMAPAYQDRFVIVLRTSDLHGACAASDAMVDIAALYRDFYFEAALAPRFESLLSVHPTDQIAENALRYFSRPTWGWKSLNHITIDANGESHIQSSDSAVGSLDDMLALNPALWLLRDPLQDGMSGAFATWLDDHYHLCQRAAESDSLAVDHYLRRPIPCGLVNADEPLAAHYDAGGRLMHVEHVIDSGTLSIYLWWADIRSGEDAYSIQLFDADGEKAGQIDAMMAREPVAAHSIDISALPPGEYRAALILYDYVSRSSYGGVILATNKRFDRALEVARFVIEDD